ncbi:MAG TPA: malate dehydrogenase [bacterium]
MGRTKITVVGAGNVGATTALRLAQKELGDVVLIDILGEMAQGKALDIMESAPVAAVDVSVVGGDNYGAAANSDIVVITSGVPRKPGMSRDDLLKTNVDIVKKVTEGVAKAAPNSIIIVVANPLDAMTYTAYKVSKFPKNRVMGMAGILDTARFRTFLGMELKVSVENIHAFVLGGHGDTMVPLTRYTTVAGVPVGELIPKAKLDAIVQRTRDGGGEIVKLLKTGSAYYAPAESTVEMVDSILKDKRKILPCAALCEGEYGIKDIFVGVPVILGSRGIEKIFEIKLAGEEKAEFEKSVKSVQELCQMVDGLLR